MLKALHSNSRVSWSFSLLARILGRRDKSWSVWLSVWCIAAASAVCMISEHHRKLHREAVPSGLLTRPCAAQVGLYDRFLTGYQQAAVDTEIVSSQLNAGQVWM